MKKFKTADLYISIALIIGFLIVSLIRRDGTFVVGYFVVGGWQVISMIMHVVNKWFTEKWGVRFIYHLITLVALVTAPLGGFYVLLFVAPFMAVFYAWICYNELHVKMVRPLDQLK
ncbi:hypothetical protein ACQ33O_01200 [Ferruginibacter sp. SUN002]|uniref:hypothetical protein n=1 Tax=Ferruginibacter sp. SUN002 TaxID=2937789 RepID=UPI003D36738D